MPPELVALLKDCDTLAKSVQGAVSSAARDIRKEVVYLAGELDIATSSDAREAVFAKIGKRLKKLRGRVDGLTSALNAKIADAAAGTVKEKCGDLVRIDAKHEKAIIEAVSGIGGANMAATMTGAMNQNIVTALRDATTAAFREQAVSGLTARELEEVIKSKWEAAAKNPKNLQFVDKAGKLWDTDTYVNMNVRTNAMRIYNETVIQDIANTTGSDLVMVSRGGDCNCRLCFPWEGRILSISGKTPGFPSYSDAIKAGLFHPNCVHTVEVVDKEWDADEIALQRQFPPPEGLKPKDMDDQRYEMDVARTMRDNPDMDATAARIAVDRVNLETSMRQGLITDKAQAIVDGLTDEQVEALCPNGNPPQFLPSKYNDGEDGYHPGSKGGVVYLHRTDPTLEKLLAATDIGEGVEVKPFELEKEVDVGKRFVGSTARAKAGIATIEKAKGKADALFEKVAAYRVTLANAAAEAKKVAAAVGDDLLTALIGDTFGKVSDTAGKVAVKLKKMSDDAAFAIGLLAAAKPPENEEKQAEQDKWADETAESERKKVDGYLALFGSMDWAKDPAAMLANIKNQAQAFWKSRADEAGKDIAGKQETQTTYRVDRLAKGREIEALADAANLERKKKYPDVGTFRQAYRSMRQAEGELDALYQQFHTAYASGNFEAAIKLSADVTAKWNAIGAYGSYQETYQTLVEYYGRAKAFLEERAGQSGESAVKAEEAAERNYDAPLKSYTFPDEVTEDMLEGGKSLGGTTGARLVTIEGRKYIMKRGGNTSDAHLQNEMAANGAYRAAGIRVPDFKTYTLNGETVSLSEFIPNCVTLGEYMGKATDAQKKAVVRQLRKGFAIDALFANHDVLGTGGDNVLVDPDGNAWRIDNGSAFGFRAQGEKKNPALYEKREWIDDLWTMRGLNPNGTKSTVSLPYGEAFTGDQYDTAKILRAAKGIDFDKVVATLPKEVRAKLEKPLAELKDLVAVADDFDRGNYDDGAASIAIDSQYCFAKTGVRADIPAVAAKSVSSIDPAFRGSADEAGSEYVGDGGGEKLHLKVYMGADIGTKLVTAAKSIAAHIDSGDFNANETSIAAALETEKALKDLKKQYAGKPDAKIAETYLDVIEKIKAAKAGGYKQKIGMVKAKFLPDWAEEPPKKKKQGGKKLTLTAKVQDFVETDGYTKPADPARYRIVTTWNEAQAGSSWSADACKAKILEYRARGMNPDPRSGGRIGGAYNGIGPNGEVYGIRSGHADGDYLDKWDFYKENPDAYERDFKAFMQYKGCVMSILRRTSFPGKQTDGTYLVCRTEGGDMMRKLKAYEGKFCKAHMSSCESSSVFDPFGSYMTVRRLPLSRVNSCYLFGRSKTQNQMLLGDNENEITVDITGEEPVYIYGSTYSNEDARAAFLKAEKGLKHPETLEWANP